MPQVVAGLFDFPAEGAALGSAQHVEETPLRLAEPTDAVTPVIVKDPEGGPSPVELADHLHEPADWASAVTMLDVVAEAIYFLAQFAVTIDLAARRELGFCVE